MFCSVGNCLGSIYIQYVHTYIDSSVRVVATFASPFLWPPAYKHLLPIRVPRISGNNTTCTATVTEWQGYKVPGIRMATLELPLVAIPYQAHSSYIRVPRISGSNTTCTATVTEWQGYKVPGIRMATLELSLVAIPYQAHSSYIHTTLTMSLLPPQCTPQVEWADHYKTKQHQVHTYVGTA